MYKIKDLIDSPTTLNKLMLSMPISPTRYCEKHRPQFHFSPPLNWSNDPNGLVYYRGKYHLFYQHNPDDKVWGNMSWGHATSHDLIHWQHHVPAISPMPSGLGYIFSGSVVVDWYNTSGLGSVDNPPLIAIFTQNSRFDEQVQSIAYSQDEGTTWQHYAHNPVIANPGLSDFRDPKVIWHAPSDSWIMVLAVGQQIRFYRSSNLLDWTFVDDFGQNYGAHGGVWECPDLFPLKMPDNAEEKWVLLVSLNPGGPNGGSATQYFIGEFNGQHFVQQHTEILWLDYGPDCYASVTWSDIPKQDGRRIMLAWMTNWEYASHQPTAPWRGAMTFPRELSLLATNKGLRLSSRPIAELALLRQPNPICHNNLSFAQATQLDKGQTLADSLELNLVIDWSAHLSDEWFLRFYNEQNEALIIDFKSSINQIKIDRSKANFRITQHKEFNRKIKAPVELPPQKQLALTILKDASSLEIFTQDGLCVLSTNFFVNAPLDRLQIQSGHSGLPLEIKSAKIHSLKSIWR